MMKQLISILLLCVLSISPLPAQSNSVTSPTINDICRRPKKPDNTLRIDSPKLGQLVTGSMVTVKLKLGRSIDEQSLRVWLNGKNVTERFSRGRCRADHCEDKATLLPLDGLRTGDNGLRATARGFDKHIEFQRVRFDYGDGGIGGVQQPHWLPSTVGFSVNQGGAQPWVSLTTGTPAALNDPIDPTLYSTPYPDMTFPQGNDTACTQTYQVVVLNRQNPINETDYKCFADSASLKTYLTGLPAGQSVVIAGTTYFNNAATGLDTSSIGGTDYTSPFAAASYPQGYVIIGVPGSAPGTAYESYYTSDVADKPYERNPSAQGTLALDQNFNYNFHAGGDVQFEVASNNPTEGTFVAWNNGSARKYQTNQSSQNGFWLLVLDRVTLEPVDSTNDSNGPCIYGESSSGCGTFFNTGSANPAAAASAAGALNSALNQVSPRQLLFLTAVGQPFQGASSVPATLATNVSSLGGSGYTLQSLTNSASAYTLIAPGVFRLGPLTASHSPFSQGIVTSSSSYSQQSQTGFVRGVLSRDNQSLYAPSVSSQEDGKRNATGATTLSINYDFYSIASQSPTDWPLTDTSGHIAAYHYASAEYLKNHNSETGSHSQDLRYFCAGDPAIGQNNTDFLPSSPFYPAYPGYGHGFTAQDLTDASAQLYTELTALNNANTYLGANGIGNLMTEKSGVADQVIQATYQILSGQVGAVDSTKVSISATTWMSLIASVASVAAPALGPLGLPVAGAALGVTSGILRTGVALAPFLTDDKINPPSDENAFDVELGKLDAQASKYSENLAISYATALDNIYSDWGKLKAVGANVADSDSGWQFTNQLTSTALGAAIAAGVERSIYLQTIPQFYQMDTYSAQPISNISSLGLMSVSNSYYPGHVSATNYHCYAAYPTSPVSEGFSILPSPQLSKKNDIYVLGGTINYQNSDNVSEALLSQTMLDTLFGAANLNIPADLFYASTLITQRSGPSRGFFLCYKPGCKSSTFNDSNAQQTCTGP